MSLFNLFLSRSGRSALKNLHYFPIYERHLSRFVGQSVLLFEVGTGEGGSAQLWKSYFGPLAQIVTIDIRDMTHVAEEQIYPRQGDQSDANFLFRLVQEFGAPDIVLDDGSHRAGDVVASFSSLYPLMSPRGVYLVEDMNAAYYPEYGGGLGHAGSFIERSKMIIDEINARHTDGALPESETGKSTFSISFYDMVVVLEKAPYANRDMVRRP